MVSPVKVVKMRLHHKVKAMYMRTKDNTVTEANGPWKPKVVVAFNSLLVTVPCYFPHYAKLQTSVIKLWRVVA